MRVQLKLKYESFSLGDITFSDGCKFIQYIFFIFKGFFWRLYKLMKRGNLGLTFTVCVECYMK